MKISKIKNQKIIVKKVKEAHRNAIMKDDYRQKLSDGIKSALQSPELRKKWSECKTGNKNGRALAGIHMVPQRESHRAPQYLILSHKIHCL